MTQAGGLESPVRTPRDAIRNARMLVRKTMRRWPVLVGALVVASLAFVVAPRIFKAKYKSETVLLYREIIQAGTVLDPGYQIDSRKQLGPRLREMMLSRTNLENVITELHLYPDIVKSRGMLDAVDEMRLNTDFRIRDGDTFSIAFTGEDPALVYAVTRKLADSLMEQANRYRVEEAQSTKEFLETEQKRTEDQLRSKEEELARFLAIHPEFAQDSVSTGGQTTGASVRAAERRNAGAGVDPAMQALERQALRLRQQLRAPAAAVPPVAGPAAGPALDPESAAAIQRAQQDLASARQRLADLLTRFTPQHPDVQAAEARVREAQAALDQARASAKTAAPEPTVAGAPIASETTPDELRAQLNRVEASLAAKKRGAALPATAAADEGNRIVALETEWAGLNRDVNDVRERNQQIQNRLFRASIIANVESNDAANKMVVVDPAFEPTRPSSMGARRTGAAAALMVFLLGLGAAVVAALFDDRVYDEIDIQRLGIGKLAHVIAGGTPGRKRKTHG